MIKALVGIGKALLYLIVYFGIQLVFVLGLALYYLLSGEVDISSGNSFEVSNSLTKLLMSKIVLITIICNTISIVVFWLVALIRKRKIKEEFYLKPIPITSALLIMLLGFFLSIFLSYGMDLLSRLSPEVNTAMIDYNEKSSFMLTSDPTLVVILSIISAPITEELLLRGIFFTRLRDGLPQVVAVVITSVTFGALHGQIIWAAYAAVFGILLNIIFIKYKSLFASILMHFAFNSVGSVGIISKAVFHDFSIPVETAVTLGAAAISIVFMVLVLKRKHEPKTL